MNGARDCAGCSDDLYAGLRGELPPGRAEDLRSHLAQCPACAARERQSRALIALLESLPEVGPAPDAFSRLRSRIESGDTPAPARPRRLRLVFPLLAAAAAAVLLLLPGLGGPGGRLTTRTTEGGLLGGFFRGDRRARLTLSPDAMAEPAGHRALRIRSGRVLADVAPGPGRLQFILPHGEVEVTGTILVFEVRPETSRVAVVTGSAIARADGAAVPLTAGTAVDLGAASAVPYPVDVWRVRDWCSAPTATLSPDPEDPRALAFTLGNRTPDFVLIRKLDPSEAVYSLVIRGPDVTLSTVLRRPMVTRGARGPGEVAFETLSPGQSATVSFAVAKLGLAPGEYEIRAVYRPYGDLPAEVWRGNLETEPVRVTVP
jgi:hypothetical protein